MMTDLANSSAHVDDSKNLRNAHIINKSYIVHRKSYIANAFPNAFALRREGEIYLILGEDEVRMRENEHTWHL